MRLGPAGSGPAGPSLTLPEDAGVVTCEGTSSASAGSLATPPPAAASEDRRKSEETRIPWVPVLDRVSPVSRPRVSPCPLARSEIKEETL